jgi:gliding motility-associated-like protein
LKTGGHYILTKLLFTYLLIIGSWGIINAQAPVAVFTANTTAGCSPLIVNFQDQSTGSPATWSWDFGNGNTSSLQNPTASYFTPGTYTVSLTVTNANGTNTLTRSQFITVYENPTVDFTVPTRNGCFPFRVQFTDISTPGAGNTNVSWQWDFGNGVTSTQQNPFVTYSTAGNFSITLRVTNDKGCTRVISRPAYISVTPGVTAAFTNSQPTVCSAPATINFTNNSNGPGTLNYLWDFGDGNLSGATSPSHIYTINGTYIATLVVLSSQGCEDTVRSGPITIGGNITNFNAPLTACINETISFTNASTPVPVSTTWDFGDATTANTINTTHSYAATGNYIVRMYNTYANCMDSSIQSITINPRPIADFDAPDTTKCEPDLTVNFQDLSTGGVTAWQWDFGDGSVVSTLQNPSHTYTTYGSFTVRLIVTNGFGCTDTISKPNFVIIRRASIQIPQLPDRGCVPYTINFNPTINTVDVVTSYLWDFGDGGTATIRNPIYTYNTQGTYTVKLFITTSGGCTDSIVMTQAVRVGNKPVVDFSIVPNPVCGKQPVQFNDLTNVADEWFWNFGDGGTSNIQNPIHNYADTGLFTIRLIATNNGCPDTLERIDYMRVEPPIALFNIIPNCSDRLLFTFTDRSLADPAKTPLTWEWDFGDGNTSTLQNPTHTYAALGFYPVRLIVTNGTCKDTVTNTARAIDENPTFVADVTVACKRATINFTSTVTNPANIVNYEWDFGDGGGGNTTQTTATYTYITSGTYTVRLITTDLNGCRDTSIRSNYIRINGPLANYTPGNTGGCTGLTPTFTDNSTTDGVNALTNWTWNWGDASTNSYATVQTPFTHQFNTTGTFSVQLIVTDAAGCRDSITLPNVITTTDPVPNFISADTLTCPNANVAFTNTSSPAGMNAFWDFGNGNTSTTYSPTTTYALTGQYNVKLVVTDSYGCSDSLIRNLYIRVDEPNAAFTVNDSASSCMPFEVRFTNNSTYYTSSSWNFGDGGTSNATSPTHYYSNPGNYVVRLIVTSPGGCTDSAFITIRTYDTVGTRVNYLPLSGCKPLVVALTSFTTGPMASYFWDFGDGNTITTTTPNINHIYTSFGNFLPKIIMEDQTGCLIPVQGFDTVFVTGANNKFGYSDSVFCNRGTVNFTDSTTFNDPVLNFSWNFGDGNTSNIQNPSHTYTSPGLYTVRLATETVQGCRDTLIKPLIIRVVQSPITNIGGDSVFCVNSTRSYTGDFVTPDTSIVRWQWIFPNGNTSTLQNPPPQTFNTAGNLVITAIATNSTGCTDTTTKNLLIHPLPTATLPGQITVQAGFPVTIPATYSSGTNTWLWSPAQGLSCTDCPTPDADPNFNTNYIVYFTDDNGCSNTANVLVTVICKNANIFMPNTFTPNGNGANEIFYPRGRGIDRVKSMRIFNRWGEVVFEKFNFQPNDASAGWNGTYKGNKPQSDVYVYQLEVFCDNGDTIKLNGNVSLIL